jgi:hypothetical protein
MKFKNSRLVTVIFLEVIALCLIISFRSVNIAATAALVIFSTLFLSLTIHLNGTFNRKIAILTLGNIIGLLWNFVLHYFVIVGGAFFGEPFNVFCAVSYPFLNFMWIVSFWSLSLAFLPKSNSTQAEMTP